MIVITIFAISPEYLDALYQEALSFNFTLQGYGNEESAMKGLQYTNVSEIIGFLYMAERLPKDITKLQRFILICDKIAENSDLTFLFVLRGKFNPTQVVGEAGLQHLKIKVLTLADDVTDTLIKRDVFGTLLLSRFSPYVFDNTTGTPNDYQQATIPVLEYCPVFPDFVLEVLAPSVQLVALDHTLQADGIYQKLLGISKLAAEMRKLVIMKRLGMETSRIEQRIGAKVEETEDISTFCNYNALFQLAKEEVATDAKV